MKLLRGWFFVLLLSITLGLSACGSTETTENNDDDTTDDTTDDDSTSDDDTDDTADDDSDTATGTMSFFVTSEGSGASGGNLGGVNGADTTCQTRIDASTTPAAVKAKTWKAYLCTSTQDARDVIGNGPWYNFNGTEVASSVADLHSNGIAANLILDETGDAVPSAEHDILTGCAEDGTLISGADAFPDNPAAASPVCQDWSSNSANDYAWVGHTDWSAAEDDNWNSVHAADCSEAGLELTAGAGRIYCFATN